MGQIQWPKRFALSVTKIFSLIFTSTLTCLSIFVRYCLFIYLCPYLFLSADQKCRRFCSSLIFKIKSFYKHFRQLLSLCISRSFCLFTCLSFFTINLSHFLSISLMVYLPVRGMLILGSIFLSIYLCLSITLSIDHFPLYIGLCGLIIKICL